MINNYFRPKVVAGVAILSVMWVIFFLIEQYTPFQLDNPLFERSYLDCSGGEVKFAWRAFVDYIAVIRDGDNWRLCNILAPVTTLFMPKWLFSALTATVFVGTAWMMARFMGRGRVEPFSLAFTWTGMIIFLPYSYTLFVGDYALNYIFGGALSLLLVTLLFNRSEAWRHRVAVVVLAAVVGWWHEGFALSIVAGLMGWAILKRGRVPLIVYAASVVLTLVSLSVALCPGMMARIATRESGNSALLHDAVKAVVHNCLTVALLVIVSGRLIMPRYRKSTLEMLRDPRVCFFMMAAVAGFLLSIVTSYSARTAYWPQICSMIVPGMWGYTAVRARVKGRAVWAVALVCAAQGAVAVTWCCRLDRQHDKVMALVEASPYKTAFCDVIYPEDVPWYCFRMPAAIEWVEQFNYWVWNDRYFKLQNSMGVVPTALNRDLTRCEADTVGVDPVVRRVGDALITERIETAYGAENVTCNITLTDGTRMDGSMALMLDFCDPEGHPFTYIKPFGLRGDAVKSIEMILH